MRILYLDADPGVPVFGPKGASVHVRAMAAAMTRAGHQVAIVPARTGEPPAPPPRFLVLPELPAPPRGLEPGAAEAFALEHRAECADALRRIARAFRPDLIYERHALWCEAGVEVARGLGVPHLLEVNAPLIEESLRFRSLAHPVEAEAIAARVFSGTSVALAVSRAVAAYAVRHGARIVRWFPNAVDATLFRREPRARDGAAAPVLGFCGSLKPWHGLEALVAVLARVRARVTGASLRVLGDGPGRGGLEAEAARLGVRDALELCGPVAHEEVPARLEGMDVALAPHPALEPFWFSPLKIFEYQAAGLPVIATRQGDLPLLIEHGRTGVLVEPGDVDGMAEWALALHRDRARAAALGAAARAEVLRRHTWERRVQELEEMAGAAREGARA